MIDRPGTKCGRSVAASPGLARLAVMLVLLGAMHVPGGR